MNLGGSLEFDSSVRHREHNDRSHIGDHLFELHC